MVFAQLCPPALIYLIFSITQVTIDSVKGEYNTALVKIWVAFIFTILLNYLCQQGLGVVSWLIVFIPFMLMSVIVTMLLIMFGLDPTTGEIKVPYNHGKVQRSLKQDVREIAKRKRHSLDRFNREEYAKWRRYNESKSINKQYDKSNISHGQKKVLEDVVEKRSQLSCDPLHEKC
jgi:hypothetical protein